MTDPNVPSAPQPAGAPAASYPGKTLGIVGLVLSFLVAIAGLIVSAIALSQSKKAGYKNTPALVGLILGIVFSVLWIIFWVFGGALFAAIVSNCPEVAPGQYVC